MIAVDPGWSLVDAIDFTRPMAPHFSPVDGLIHVGRAGTTNDGVYRLEADGSVTVGFMDPSSVLKLVDVEGIETLAGEVRARLERVRDAVAG